VNWHVEASQIELNASITLLPMRKMLIWENVGFEVEVVECI
jgi:hypothetical protein